MTNDDIKQLAKQAGGTPYTNRHYPGETAMAFGPVALNEFVRLAREVPAGYQLVPIEPTEAMLKAGHDCPVSDDGTEDCPEDYRNVYKAMLEAAKGEAK